MPLTGVPYEHVWALDTDLVSESPAEFLLEGSLQHALLLAGKMLTSQESVPDYLAGISGNWRTIRALHRWLTSGSAALLSGAAPGEVEVWLCIQRRRTCSIK